MKRLLALNITHEEAKAVMGVRKWTWSCEGKQVERDEPERMATSGEDGKWSLSDMNENG